MRSGQWQPARRIPAARAVVAATADRLSSTRTGAASPVPGTGGIVLGMYRDKDELVKLPGDCVFSTLLMPDLNSGHDEPGAIGAMTAALMYLHSHP